MSDMISVDGLTVEFGGYVLFDSVSYVVNKKDRIALVGKNGAGKSTMLKIFAGLQVPTRGNVTVPKDVSIGYLPQQMIHNDGRTVQEEAETAFNAIFELQAEIEQINLDLVAREDYESESYHQLIEDLTHKSERLAMSDVNNYKAEVEKTLLGLGFVRSDFDRLTEEFSGGWRMRVELAKLLLQRPDVLLLDEPTNHLDIESIQWLENFLANHANAVILVSHDRAFINAVTTRTIEISLGKIYDYKVPYYQYLELRKEHRDQQMRAYENQQKMIQETEDFIERFRYQATKAVQVQSRIKQLEKVQRLEVDDEDNASLSLKFPPAPRSGSFPVIMDELRKDYDHHTVIKHVTLTINRGDKVAFVGKNGEGKSTLVKCILGEIPYTGSLKLGHNVKIGYFAQNQASLLDESMTVFDTIDQVAVGDIRTKIRDILGAFMFGGEASDKKVKVLSGGERSRLAMIRLLLEPVNLLVLDEPTNHLDMRTKDVLKKAIKDFDGTVIVVSHDREFLDGLVEKVYEFGGGRVMEHLGGIQEFLERKKMGNLRDLELQIQASKQDAFEKAPSENKLSYEARKEFNRQVKRLEKLVEQSETQIEVLEKQVKQTESMMFTPEGASNVALLQLHSKSKKALSEKMEEWEKATMDLEALRSQTD
jgi:ATP-binding cassette, subfamily F, member 3